MSPSENILSINAFDVSNFNYEQKWRIKKINADVNFFSLTVVFVCCFVCVIIRRFYRSWIKRWCHHTLVAVCPIHSVIPRHLHCSHIVRGRNPWSISRKTCRNELTSLRTCVLSDNHSRLCLAIIAGCPLIDGTWTPAVPYPWPVPIADMLTFKPGTGKWEYCNVAPAACCCDPLSAAPNTPLSTLDAVVDDPGGTGIPVTALPCTAIEPEFRLLTKVVGEPNKNRNYHYQKLILRRLTPRFTHLPLPSVFAVDSKSLWATTYSPLPVSYGQWRTPRDTHYSQMLTSV